MITWIQKKNLAVNSLGLFIFSFMCIKLAVLLLKYFVASIYTIQTSLVNFRLMGISPANSGVWSKESVYSFYSIDLIVSLLVFLVSFISSFSTKSKIKSSYLKIRYLWFGFSAAYIFNSALIAGIATQTNVFHFLDFLNIPDYIMLLIAEAAFVGILFFSWVYCKRFLITSPIDLKKTKVIMQRTVIFYAVFLPLMSAIVLLFITSVFSFHRYEFCELLVLFIMALPSLFYFFPIKTKRYSRSFSESSNYLLLSLGISSSVAFMCISCCKYLLK